MKEIKNIRLPFFFVTSLSIALMLVIIYAHYQADKSITGLRNGNLDAVNVFRVRLLVDEAINGIYTVEAGSANISSEQAKKNILDTIELIQKSNRQLDSFITSAKSKYTGKQLVYYVNRKVQPYYELLSVEDTDYAAIRANARKLSAATNALSDSIFFAATDLENQMSDYLQNNIAGNDKLASKVSQIDLKLTLIIIIAIATLATIIILSFLRNFRLLQQVSNERMEAEKAASVKEQFLANMSHEIRTPVNAVIGFTSLLEKTKLDALQKQHVGLIKNASENLLSIVNDILDISKIEAGMLHLDKSPFSLREVCYSNEMLFMQRAKEKGLQLSTFIDDALPDVVIGDKERLSQILMNLTSNAIKFTDKGFVKVMVEGAIKNRIAHISFVVEDSGIGVRAEKQKVIFERFEQGEKDTNRKFGGTGLGLSIVKSLVEMHGGTIAIRSREGEGARFCFDLNYPVGEAAYAPREASVFSGREAGKVPMQPAFPGRSVLVAEDNKMNQLLLQMIFQQMEIDITVAQTGIDAVNALHQKSFDLILMDIQMPEMDGYTATAIARNELKCTAPIIAMTANVLPGEKDKCLRAGMNGYLSKPIQENEFYKLLEEFMGPSVTNTAANIDYINREFISEFFNNDKTLMLAILEKFSIQYPEEVGLLQKHIHGRNFEATRKLSHSMVSTLNAVNDEGPLYAFLKNIELADNSENGWISMEENFQKIISSLPLVLKQVAQAKAQIAG